MKTENTFKCPIAIWRKFTDKQKVVYHNMRTHKAWMVTPPDMKISTNEWDVISHNMACLAAWEVK